MNRFFLLLLLPPLFVHALSAKTPCYPNLPNATYFYQPDTGSLPPAISCPPSVTISLTGQACDTAYLYTVAAYDDEPGFLLTIQSGISSGDPFPIGATVNQFLVTDIEGQTAGCSFTVTVRNNPQVSLTCVPSYALALDSSCQAMVQPINLLTNAPGALGCLDIYYVEHRPPGTAQWSAGGFDHSDIGVVFQYIVRNTQNNNYCLGALTVVDTFDLRLTCNDLTVPCALDTSMLSAAWMRDSLGIEHAYPDLTLNCTSPFSLTYIDQDFNNPCNSSFTSSAYINRFWTLRDSLNHTATCLQVIERRRQIADIHLPDSAFVFCSAYDTSSAATGRPFVQIGSTQIPLTPSEECEFLVQYTDSVHIVGPCVTEIRRRWTVRQLCLPTGSPNSLLTGVQIITVTDDQGPIISCPPYVIVESDSSNADCTVRLDLPDVSLSDNCSEIDSVWLVWPQNGQFLSTPGELTTTGDTVSGHFGLYPAFQTGVTYVEFHARDACGQAGLCSTQIEVWDKTPPVAVCRPLTTVYLDEQGQYFLKSATLDSLSDDDCNDLIFRAKITTAAELCLGTFQGFTDSLIICCMNSGDTLQYELRAYDLVSVPGAVVDTFAQGHWGACTGAIVVVDTLPPNCVAPPSQTILCGDFDPTLAAYGLPLPTCSVDSVAILTDLSLFDTLCHEGVIHRTFTVFTPEGLSASCAQQIEVQREQLYYIRFPNDILTTDCNESAYGAPILGNLSCENMVTSFSDVLFTIAPDACYRIERTWLIYNQCTYQPTGNVIMVPNPEPVATANHPENRPGPVVSAPSATGEWLATTVSIVPGPPPTNYNTFWSPTANAYRYKQIIKIFDTVDPVVISCPPTTQSICDSTVNNAQLWNSQSLNDPNTQSHDLREGPAPLRITATDGCAQEDLYFSYLLFLDLDQNGTQETVIDSDNAQPNEVLFNNISSNNYCCGTPIAFDSRPVPISSKYRFTVQKLPSNNDTITAQIAWNTTQQPTDYTAAQLPPGTHRIVWSVDDRCGNSKTCTSQFTISCCQAPTVQCVPPITLELNGIDSVLVWNQSLLQFSTYGCGAFNELRLAVHKGVSNTYPLNANGEPNAYEIYRCEDVGTSPIELWIRDGDGLTGKCTTTITLTDTLNGCVPDTAQKIVLNVLALTPDQDPVKSVSLHLSASLPPALGYVYSGTTDSTGMYVFPAAVPLGGNFTLSPYHNSNHVNGVSTIDLVAINKHILGAEPFGDPFKIIAADINRSETLTGFDIVEARKLILGIYSQFPQNTSWRFVPYDYVFPMPANPFFTAFDTSVIKTNVVTDPTQARVVAVKIGDVNYSANGIALSEQDDRTSASINWYFDDRLLEAGETALVNFESEQALVAAQFTLHADGLEIVDIEGDKDAYALMNHNQTATACWFSDRAETHRFGLRVRALKAGRLSDMLYLSDQITRAAAWQATNEAARRPVLTPIGASVGAHFYLYPTSPNPFGHTTAIQFSLPEQAVTTLRVGDARGQIRWSQKQTGARGSNTVVFDGATLESGLYWISLETPWGIQTQKMTKI